MKLVALFGLFSVFSVVAVSQTPLPPTPPPSVSLTFAQPMSTVAAPTTSCINAGDLFLLNSKSRPVIEIKSKGPVLLVIYTYIPQATPRTPSFSQVVVYRDGHVLGGEYDDASVRFWKAFADAYNNQQRPCSVPKKFKFKK